MKVKFLVTGGLGFIGNELVRQLLEEGSIAILDNRTRVAPRIDDIRDVPVIEADLTDHHQVASVVRELTPEVVFHLAAIHYIPECNANPERTIRTNVEATLGLLRTCAAVHVKHFLLASSGAVYADSPDPLRESSPVAPVDIYGWSKLHAEQLCTWFAPTAGLPVTLCRLFNNYGPRETNPHIIPEVINQLKSQRELKLGNITTRRDYVHTSDTARAFRLLARRTPSCGEVRIVNVASGQHASVAELIDILGELLQRKITVVRDEARFRKADKQVQVANTEKLIATAGWERQVDLRAGLRALLEFEGLLPVR
jgi:UDP-glucose 4-epimerase